MDSDNIVVVLLERSRFSGLEFCLQSEFFLHIFFYLIFQATLQGFLYIISNLLKTETCIVNATKF